MQTIRASTAKTLRRKLIAPFGIRGCKKMEMIDGRHRDEIPIYRVNPLFDLDDATWGRMFVASVSAAAARACTKWGYYGADHLEPLTTSDQEILPHVSFVTTLPHTYDTYEDHRKQVRDLNPDFRPSKCVKKRPIFERTIVGGRETDTFPEEEVRMAINFVFSICLSGRTIDKMKVDVLRLLAELEIDPERKIRRGMPPISPEDFALLARAVKHVFGFNLYTHRYKETYDFGTPNYLKYILFEKMIQALRTKFVNELRRFADSLPELT